MSGRRVPLDDRFLRVVLWITAVVWAAAFVVHVRHSEWADALEAAAVIGAAGLALEYRSRWVAAAWGDR